MTCSIIIECFAWSIKIKFPKKSNFSSLVFYISLNVLPCTLYFILVIYTPSSKFSKCFIRVGIRGKFVLINCVNFLKSAQIYGRKLSSI